MTTMATESRISPQAQKVIDALLAIGIPRNEFSVRTDRHRITSVNPATGERERYTEYGDAGALFKSKKASDLAIAHAQELANRNLTVSIHTRTECGHDAFVLVYSAWNGSKRVERRPLDGKCMNCR